MEELVQASFAPANVFATGLLIFVLLYWLTVILGVLDISSFDIEIEVDADSDAQGVSSIAWLNSALAFFNLGRIPLMFFLTFFALPFWVMSVGVNHVLGTASGGIGFLLMLPYIIASLLLSKILTMPFVHLFAHMEKEEAPNTVIIGQMCTVLLPANSTDIGQAAVKTKGAPMLLNVRTSPGGQLVQKGETALVIDYLPENNLYLIEPYQSL